MLHTDPAMYSGMPSRDILEVAEPWLNRAKLNAEVPHRTVFIGVFVWVYSELCDRISFVRRT